MLRNSSAYLGLRHKLAGDSTRAKPKCIAPSAGGHRYEILAVQFQFNLIFLDLNLVAPILRTSKRLECSRDLASQVAQLEARPSVMDSSLSFLKY